MDSDAPECLVTLPYALANCVRLSDIDKKLQEYAVVHRVSDKHAAFDFSDETKQEISEQGNVSRRNQP